MVRKTKQQRKYPETVQEKPKKETKKKKKGKESVFKVLVDNSNFLPKEYPTQAEAQTAGDAFCLGSNSIFYVVESTKCQ